MSVIKNKKGQFVKGGFKNNVENHIGEIFPGTQWLVLGFSHLDKNGGQLWSCRCSCGIDRPVYLSSLKNSKSRSCMPCARKNVRGTGSYLDHSGYVIRTHWSLDHPEYLTRKDKVIAEHVYVMSCYMGRPLTDNETVNHINGVRDDNRLENLQFRISNHGKGQPYVCSDCGSDRIHAVPIADEEIAHGSKKI